MACFSDTCEISSCWPPLPDHLNLAPRKLSILCENIQPAELAIKRPKSMMTFPKMVISAKDYNDHITALLKDQECIIFLDTNILSKMYSLYATARSEFYSWVRLNKDDNRIKVPAWCIHEYSNKVVRNELGQYTSAVTGLLKTNSKSLPQLIRHLTFFIDDKTATDAGYTDRNDLLAKIFDAQEKLVAVLPTTQIAKRIANSETDVHKEIMDMFGDIILQSDIFSLMKNCYGDYETRFANKMPPGFQDKGKGRNEIGDYVIWRELMEAAKLDSIKKIIYVSDDLKNDWVYAPPFILNAANKREGNPQEEGRIYLVDPRLEYEISIAVNHPVDIIELL